MKSLSVSVDIAAAVNFPKPSPVGKLSFMRKPTLTSGLFSYADMLKYWFLLNGIRYMTCNELVNKLADSHYGVTTRDVERSVKLILNAISDSLAKGDRIEIRGFGSFCLTERPPRIGRNPRTGEKVHVPAKARVYFKPGKELRERVDTVKK